MSTVNSQSKSVRNSNYYSQNPNSKSVASKPKSYSREANTSRMIHPEKIAVNRPYAENPQTNNDGYNTSNDLDFSGNFLGVERPDFELGPTPSPNGMNILYEDDALDDDDDDALTMVAYRVSA